MRLAAAAAAAMPPRMVFFMVDFPFCVVAGTNPCRVTNQPKKPAAR
jgi:hypothetical protein